MLVYRVFPHLYSATSGTPGHPDYLHKVQGGGRFDNPSRYYVWYFSLEMCGAVGETFGDLDEWSDGMFNFPALAGSQRALAIYSLPDGISILDLDDARNLLERGLRPTQVVERNRSATQAWALRIFDERNGHGKQAWLGVKWWSFHRPQWQLLAYWGSAKPSCVDVQALSITHPAVVDAAATLQKRIS